MNNETTPELPIRPRVPKRLGDFDVNPRVLLISALALVVGGMAALVADGLLKLIGLITNLVFYQRVALSLVAPGGGHNMWWLIIAAPVVGGLIVGLMARYGAEATGAWAPGIGKRKLEQAQRLYPVLDGDEHMVGLITRHQLLDAAFELAATPETRIDDVMICDMVLGYPDMTLRELANLMAERDITNLPIVERENPQRVLSVMTIEHVLQGRLIDINEERKTERVLTLSLIRAVRGGMILMRRRRG